MSYQLDYTTSQTTNRSVLTALTECDAAHNCFPPTTFTLYQNNQSTLFSHSVFLYPTNYGNARREIVGDFNGDGLTDFAKALDNRVEFFLVDVTFPDLVTIIRDNIGLELSITYTPLTTPDIHDKGSDANYPDLDIQPAFYVISVVSIDDGIGGKKKLSYFYKNAKIHREGRGFLGFGSITSLDQQAGTTTVTDYSQIFPFIGQVTITRSFLPGESSGNTNVMSLTNTWATQPLNAGLTQFPYLSTSVIHSYELNDGPANAPVLTVTSTNTYDVFGNATELVVRTSGNGEAVTQTTTNTYTNDTSNWYLGRLTKAIMTTMTSEGSSLTRTSSFAYDPATGLLTREVLEPTHPQYRLQTDYTYDVFGNTIQMVISGEDILQRTSRMTYDPQGRFPLTRTNALEHTETLTYDARFGTITSLTGPNGLTTTWTYDSFGRKSTEQRVDRTQTRWTYGWCQGACVASGVYDIQKTPLGRDGATQNGPITWTTYDLLARKIATSTQGFAGNSTIIQYTAYDERGHVARVSRPSYHPAPPLWTVYTYDVLGRVVSEQYPDGTRTVLTHQGFTTTATNSRGQTHTTISNSQGHVVQVLDALQQRLSLSYDPFGNLLRTVDPQGNVTTATYDLRGRKTAMDDPDMGHWTYTYNAAGELVSQIDAKGQVATMTYDALGRLLTRTAPDMVSTWVYDRCAQGVGKLCEVYSDNGYRRVQTYDALGRPRRTSTTIDGTTYTATATYDAHGRLALQTYPTGFMVRYRYTPLGYLREVREPVTNTLYFRANAFDAEGHIVRQTFGNQFVTTQQYDPTTGRLLRQQVRGEETVMDQAYQYDTIGNLTRRTDRVSQVTESFTYDALNRLTRATARGGSGVAIPPTTYAYDALGNLTRRSDVGTSSVKVWPILPDDSSAI